MRIKWRKFISEAKYGSRNISLTTNLISVLLSKLFGLSIKARKLTQKRIIIWCKYVCSGTCPLHFNAFFRKSLTLHQRLMQVTLLKAIAHRGVKYGFKVSIRYRFQGCKATVGWFQRATWNKRCRVRLKNIAVFQTWKMKSKNSLLF